MEENTTSEGAGDVEMSVTFADSDEGGTAIDLSFNRLAQATSAPSLCHGRFPASALDGRSLVEWWSGCTADLDAK